MKQELHILLVEDNEGDIFITTELLREIQIPYKLSVVTDGWEALQFVKKSGDYAGSHEPDLILLDINLPKLNGHEVLAQMNQNPHYKNIPVIMLSTSSSEKDKTLAQTNNAFGFMTKPFHVEPFINLLKTNTCIQHFFTEQIN